MRLLDFSLPNPSSRAIALGSAQPLTEMSTRDFPLGKGRTAENLTAIYEPLGKFGNLDVSQTYGSPRPVTGIALPFSSASHIILRPVTGW
jgi:hypothetical protein